MAFFSFPSQVNERAARLVAAGVATLALAANLTGTGWLAVLIAVGFLLRVGWGPRFSPLGRLAVWAAPRIAEVRLVSGPPKRFAQGIGAAVSLSAVVLFGLGHPVAFAALLGMLTLFATLEAAFSFCLGCQIYAQLQRVGLFPADACEDCR